jgi:hypothetical protein
VLEGLGEVQLDIWWQNRHHSSQSTNLHPLKFINHRLFALNSGVSWGSWTEWEGTVGKSAPMSGGKNMPKINQAAN